jgi:UDP-GlcNAc:undecaprenyl-phosphate GlcNAc-1-phosphate transferase
MNIYRLAAITFLSSLALVWLVRKAAYRYNWVARPKEDRWHKRPTALYGGVGMFVPFMLSSLYILSESAAPPAVKFVLAGAAGAFIIGIVDDIFDLKPAIKLVGQIFMASLPISAGLYFNATNWYLVNVVITFFWFVGIMNAVNIIDNMDGLSAGVVIISTFTVLTVLVTGADFSKNDMIFKISVVFACSALGFWVFNRYPATIFMGDSGSLFLGYVLAAIAMPSSLNSYLGTSSAILALILPATILAIPIFDTTLVTIMRKTYGRPASVGGKDHSSHRLVGLGFSEKTTVLILYGLCFLGGAIAVSLKVWPNYSIFLVALFVVFLFLVGIYLGRVKVYEEPLDPEQKNLWTPLLSQLFYKRRAGEVILDIVLISTSYYFAYYLHYEGNLGDHADFYKHSLPIFISSCMMGFYVAGVYKGIWNLISLPDIIHYLNGVLLGVGMGILAVVLLYTNGDYSKSVLFIFAVTLFLMVVVSRLSFRILDMVVSRGIEDSTKTNILIYGAGQAGKILYEECYRNPDYKDYQIVGFIDDDGTKHNRLVGGVKVFSPDYFLGAEYNKANGKNIRELWLSTSQIKAERVSALVSALEKNTVEKIRLRRFKLFMEELENTGFKNGAG